MHGDFTQKVQPFVLRDAQTLSGNAQRNPGSYVRLNHKRHHLASFHKMSSEFEVNFFNVAWRANTGAAFSIKVIWCKVGWRHKTADTRPRRRGKQNQRKNGGRVSGVAGTVLSLNEAAQPFGFLLICPDRSATHKDPKQVTRAEFSQLIQQSQFSPPKKTFCGAAMKKSKNHLKPTLVWIRERCSKF